MRNLEIWQFQQFRFTSVASVLRIAIAWMRDERDVVSPRRMRHIADCGKTRVYELLAAREFEPYLNGRSRRITAHSLRRFARRLATYAGE